MTHARLPRAGSMRMEREAEELSSRKQSDTIRMQVDRIKLGGSSGSRSGQRARKRPAGCVSLSPAVLMLSPAALCTPRSTSIAPSQAIRTTSQPAAPSACARAPWRMRSAARLAFMRLHTIHTHHHTAWTLASSNNWTASLSTELASVARRRQAGAASTPAPRDAHRSHATISYDTPLC
jgi:hypothetical protein